MKKNKRFHHTFRPWCNPSIGGRWGLNGARVLAGQPEWIAPITWELVAAASGERRRVLCEPDVFDDWPGTIADSKGDTIFVVDGKWTTKASPGDQLLTMHDVRSPLFRLIYMTQNLDWVILTKHPENVARLWPLGWYDDQFTWPNVWLAVSVEDQDSADKRIPHLLQVPAAVRLLLITPRGPVDIIRACDVSIDGEVPVVDGIGHWLHWVIVRGESGPWARPMHPDWVRSIRDQCVAAGVPFFFEGWGDWIPDKQECPRVPDRFTAETGLAENRGRVHLCFRVGKKSAGRLLDGREWDEVPTVKGA